MRDWPNTIELDVGAGPEFLTLDRVYSDKLAVYKRQAFRPYARGERIRVERDEAGTIREKRA